MDLEIEDKFPVLLPKKSNITKILIRQAHEKAGHIGLNAKLLKSEDSFESPRFNKL